MMPAAHVLENSLNSSEPDSPLHNENFPDIELLKYLQACVWTAAVGEKKNPRKIHGKHIGLQI